MGLKYVVLFCNVLSRILKNRKKKEEPCKKPTLVEPEFRETVMLPRTTTHSVKMAIGNCPSVFAFVCMYVFLYVCKTYV